MVEDKTIVLDKDQVTDLIFALNLAKNNCAKANKGFIENLIDNVLDQINEQ